MNRLHIASRFVAVVTGAYAALMLIDGQLIDFGVAAAICAASSVAAGLIAYAGMRRRKAVARGRAAVWEGRDQQAATAADQQCPLCGGARQQLGESRRFVDRQGPRHARRPSTQSRQRPRGETRLGVTWDAFGWRGAPDDPGVEVLT
jgi:hypothetical protein